MAVLPLVIEPDMRLHIVSQKVEAVDDSVRRLIVDMLETMYANDGIGLAAVQVGVHKRIIVVDVAQREEQQRKPIVLINPEIVEKSDDLSLYTEGCLSLPDMYSDVERPAIVHIRYMDEQGSIHTLEAKGLLATCVQHEIDHTNGIVFTDHISKMKRDIIQRKLKKMKKLASPEPVSQPVQ